MAEKELDFDGTLYEKDDDGRITLGCGGDIAASDDGSKRNRFSRVYLKDGDTFELLMMVNGTIKKTVCSGVAMASVGKMCPVRVKTRIEPEAVEPVEPTLPDPIPPGDM